MEIIKSLAIIFFIATIVITIQLQNKIEDGKINNDKLTALEKIFTIMVSLLIPIVASNIIMYFGLRKKYPVKAKQITKIGLISLVVLLGLNLLLIGMYN